MGILVSVLQGFISYFTGSRKDNYIFSTEDKRNSNNKKNDDLSADKPKTHKACRSSNQHKLISYQSKMDNLKVDDLIYVILIFKI